MTRTEIPSSLPIPDHLRVDGWWLSSEGVCQRALSGRDGAQMLVRAGGGPKEKIADDIFR
ncbi:hypothetical protein USDA257_c26630 [Sinorhizobium fredii USDA 257]|uniref:Uncharacterized protein n=1 Tax=Sinorhizobium fredii (strain USDA 257) TaxID=1185652 RepID=I3X5T1_SINF2|nr:hypothetical protein USDA257_c26630 [Sinorhizobium fredii USDA 257]